jgi:hypothetical protein
MKFVDQWNRLHTKPVQHAGHIPTNNAYIYTAYFLAIHPNNKYLGYLPNYVPFSRHPVPVENCPYVSHDEIMGVALLSPSMAIKICHYLRHSYNQFCDNPAFVPKKWTKLNLFSTIKRFYQLSKEANPRTAVKNYPDLWNITFWQKPEYRWVYKRAAMISPSLFEKIWFVLASLFSIVFWKKNDPDLLLVLPLLHLNNKKFKLGIEGKLIFFLAWTKVLREYGTIPNMLLFKTKDLPTANYQNHPWITGELC